MNIKLIISACLIAAATKLPAGTEIFKSDFSALQRGETISGVLKNAAGKRRDELYAPPGPGVTVSIVSEQPQGVLSVQAAADPDKPQNSVMQISADPENGGSGTTQITIPGGGKIVRLEMTVMPSDLSGDSQITISAAGAGLRFNADGTVHYYDKRRNAWDFGMRWYRGIWYSIKLELRFNWEKTFDMVVSPIDTPSQYTWRTISALGFGMRGNPSGLDGITFTLDSAGGGTAILVKHITVTNLP